MPTQGKHASTTPLPPGVPNSMLDVVTAMRDSAAEFRMISAAIVRKAMAKFGTRNLTPSQRAELMDELGDLKEQFLTRVTANLSAQSSDQFMPPPPRARELYGRVGDAVEVVDVGSGNLMRLVPESGRLKITAIDEVVPDLPVTIAKVKRPAVPEDVEGKVVTSFNVLPSLAPDSELRKAIETNDGIHLIPDHKQLISKGIGKWADGRYEVSSPARDFKDHPVEGAGLQLDAYRIVSYVKERDCNITLGKKSVGSYVPNIDGSPGDPGAMNWDDLGWKWDGEPYELEIMRDGSSFLTNRSGEFYECSAQGGEQMSLHLERVQGQVSLAWVLLRVECYRGFIPPHSGEFLRYFAKRVKVKIDGVLVVGPPKLDLSEGPVLGGVSYPVDGVISRYDERDYYHKPGWTIDVCSSGRQYVRDFCEGAGLRYECPYSEPTLSEYKVVRSGGVIRLEFVRTRPDKLAATNNGTIAYILGLPTLVELVAVSGATPMTIGIRDYFLEM